MQLPGMFDPENYRSERIVSGIASISLKQAGFLCGLGALVGGPVALVAMLTFLRLESVPSDLMICVVGMFVGLCLLMLGMTVPYFIYLAKEVTKIQEYVRSIQLVEQASPTEKEFEVDR